MRIFLSAYTVRVDKKRGKEDKNKQQQPSYCRLNTFDGYTDLYDVMLAFLQGLKTNTKNDTYKTYMRAIHVEPDGRSITGVVESGVYGLSNNLRDVETDSVTYKKRKNDADVLPFYFLFYLPKDTNEGVLLLQRTGKFGIRTNLGNFLNTHFSKQYPGYLVEINALVQEELIKKILYGGIIKKLRCVKYHAPLDSIDGLDEGHQEVPFNMEIVLSANRIPFMDRIQKFFDSDCNVKSLVEIRDFKFDYDTVKLEVEVNGSIRTFDLGYLQKARTYYDISEQVVMDSDEQPTFQSIQQVAKKYLNEIIQEMYP